MSAVTPEALAEWKAAVGRTEVRSERLDRESLRRFAVAVGGTAAVERRPPPLAHWAFFLPQPTDDELGVDGHPKRGGFLPPIDLPRRMFAAADIAFEAPLLLEEQAELTTTIAAVTHKSGKSGDLVFVDVDRALVQQETVRVRERQSYVYREAGASTPMPEPATAPIEGEMWAPGPANLLRFSAATFNGHRIHYDLPYTQNEEGYPALVVHAPLTAARLASLAERSGMLKSFAFRAQAPIFLGQPVHLQCTTGEVRAVRCDGVTAMTARISHA